MACQDCFNNCTELPKPDSCILYTGPDVPELGLCKEESSLLQVENAIIGKLLSILEGSGITLADVTADCAFLNSLVNEDKTLSHLIQVLYTAVCSLKTTVGTIEAQVNTTTTFDTSCLTLGSAPTRDQILQALLVKVCPIDSRVEDIEEDYVKASELNTLIAQYNSTSSTVVQENTKMPKWVALPYHGSLSVFDAAGVGISSVGYSKVYICNGLNGTPDYRGRGPVGANYGLPGSVMDISVDPALAANTGYTIALNTKKGSYTHTLSALEGPAHTHTITDPGHDHDLSHGKDTGGDRHANGWMKWDSTTATKKTQTNTTGITIDSSGGAQPHNNLQPSVGCVFIMHIP